MARLVLLALVLFALAVGLLDLSARGAFAAPPGPPVAVAGAGPLLRVVPSPLRGAAGRGRVAVVVRAPGAETRRLAGAGTTRRSRRADRRPPGGGPRRAAWRAGPRPHVRCDARRGERARGDRERTPPARCAHRGRRRVRRVRPLALPRGSRRRSRRCRHPPHAPPPGGRRDTRDRSGTTS